MQSENQNTHDTIAHDKLRGVKAIARFIDEDERPTYYQLEKGYLPATKIGRLWIASKSRLRQHFGMDAK